MFKIVQMFTDGSCLGNPGPGGYAVILRYKLNEKILTAGFYLTTNNRMELMAVISGLEFLKKPCLVKIITDSLYVKKGIINWMPIWKENKWKTHKKHNVKNIDLWLRMDNALKRHTVEWFWTKAHIGHVENEQCDTIARQSAYHPSIKDNYYENSKI